MYVVQLLQTVVINTMHYAFLSFNYCNKWMMSTTLKLQYIIEMYGKGNFRSLIFKLDTKEVFKYNHGGFLLSWGIFGGDNWGLGRGNSC